MGVPLIMEIPAYVCSHVFHNSRPILLVSRADGDWQFLCGKQHKLGELPNVIGLNHLLARDPSLTELQKLPDDWEAERANPNEAWIITKNCNEN